MNRFVIRVIIGGVLYVLLQMFLFVDEITYSKNNFFLYYAITPDSLKDAPKLSGDIRYLFTTQNDTLPHVSYAIYDNISNEDVDSAENTLRNYVDGDPGRKYTLSLSREINYDGSYSLYLMSYDYNIE